MKQAVRQALSQLIEIMGFNLRMLHYDRHQGNVWVELATGINADLCFVLDRYDAECYIFLPDIPLINPNYPDSGRQYLLNQVLKAIDEELILDFTDLPDDRYVRFLRLIEAASDVLQETWPRIRDALSAERRMDTVRRMDKEITFRVATHELEPLTKEGQFRISGMEYGRELRSARITLESDVGIDIIMDKKDADVRTRLRPRGLPGEPFDLPDVLEAINVKPASEYWWTTISATANLLKGFWNQIVLAFDESRKAETLKRIVAIRAKRHKTAST